MFMGPSLRNSGGFRNKLFLPRNDLIPTCVPTESGNSTEFSGIPEKEAGPEPEPEKKLECTTKLVDVTAVGGCDKRGGGGGGWGSNAEAEMVCAVSSIAEYFFR